MLTLKPTKRMMLLACLTAVTFASFSISNSSTYQLPATNSNYVVIGAFSYQNNAKKFVQYASNRSLDAEFEMNPDRNLYYVYVYSSSDFEIAKKKVENIRSEFPEFYDAWVYRGILGNVNSTFETDKPLVSTETELTLRATDESERHSESKEPESTNSSTSEDQQNMGVNEFSDGSSVLADNEGQEEVSENTTTGEEGIVKKEGVYNFYFNTVNARNLREVKGRVQISDPVRAKKIQTANSHKIIEVKDPKNGAKAIKVSSEIFGYRPVDRIINLDNPVTDSTSSYVDVIGDSIVVDFDLQRYKKGDIAVMYNVYFFTNAAIMKSESVYELNSLLDMLQENDKLKVKIHGHTNGNSFGTIKYLNLDDKNFFTLKGGHKEDKGSAKKLSLERALTIQHWLIEQGIPEERMEIKGWGGKSMIHDKHDTQAHKNVRVEIEILED